MSEKKLLHFGNMQPADGIDGGENEREPGETERIAELDRATRAHDVEDDLEIEAIVAFALDEYLAMKDGQHEKQEHGNEYVENP